MAVAAVGPLNSTVAPLPPGVGVIAPEMLAVWPVCAAAVKFNPVMFAVVIVADCVEGVNWKGFAVECRPHRQLEEGFYGFVDVACSSASSSISWA